MNTTTVYIKLEIDGDHERAFEVVDRVLDRGVLQDAINEEPRLLVRSAISGGLYHAEQWVEEA